VKHGIALLSVLPLRKEPTHRSELVSQLLFGETYDVVETQEKWLKVKCTYDDYEGWLDISQHTGLTGKDFTQITNALTGIPVDLVGSATSSEKLIPIVAGSSLPDYDGMNFKIVKEKFIYNAQALVPDTSKPVNGLLEKIAMRYLHAPYLWGGRSPFGIDCSGFTQTVYKFLGIALKRDAYQQAEQGSTLNFVEEAQNGDLAFFNNEEGKIIHTGIILKDNRIIHASGKVRIDKLDHFGIYNADTKKYSHTLKIIKRVI
jgi:hypothetical protein